ncbi:DUF125-domain-containing protein, partial [Atractiella rhizophila]
QCDKHNRPTKVCCKELKGEDERNLIAPEVVRDVIIGLSDGLTVPFALTAGLSSLNSSRLVYIAGLAELISGSISMGVGGYLASEAERDHYRYMRKATRERVSRSCVGELEREVTSILSPLGVDAPLCRRVAHSLLTTEDTLPTEEEAPSEQSWFRQFLHTIARRPKSSFPEIESQKLKFQDGVGMSAFILKFGDGVEETLDSRLYISAFTIAAGYAIGGLLPMLPYFFIDKARIALFWSIGVTFVILVMFGAFKTYYTGAKVGWKGYLKGITGTVAVGGMAAGASFAIVKVFEG